MVEDSSLTRILPLVFLLGLGTGWIACFQTWKRRLRNASSNSFSDDKMGSDRELTAEARKKGCKMVLVVRNDLKMSKGKVAAQCSHATLDAYKRGKKGGARAKQVIRLWETYGQKKVTLKGDSEEQLLELQKMATFKGVTNAIIKDAGRTEVEPGTLTVLAVGPDLESKVDEITGHLKLLH
uniref:peptidyl-tRNA hydrolase n=1 Tax=Lepeophtheirus salmonis TaxID=72036 RepID=D3PHC0_LEPSM|nr:Peptidyl-tRNA hydrolase 2, mitochondrial [Lepeophtheirus salmonis]